MNSQFFIYEIFIFNLVIIFEWGVKIQTLRIQDGVTFYESLTYSKTSRTIFIKIFQKLGISQGGSDKYSVFEIRAGHRTCPASWIPWTDIFLLQIKPNGKMSGHFIFSYFQHWTTICKNGQKLSFLPIFEP